MFSVVGVKWATLIHATQALGVILEIVNRKDMKNASLLEFQKWNTGRGVVINQKNIKIKMQRLNELIGKEFGEMKAGAFEDLIYSFFEKDHVIKRQVLVSNRGDGRRGRIDMVLFPHTSYKSIALELDRTSPRKKSIFKLNEYKADESYIILRSPFTIIEI